MRVLSLFFMRVSHLFIGESLGVGKYRQFLHGFHEMRVVQAEGEAFAQHEDVVRDMVGFLDHVQA